MRSAIFLPLAAFFIGVIVQTDTAAAASLGRYKVFGVEDGDMLKLRAGPGVGFNVIVGLPNGTAVRVHSCEQTGGTRWCRVSLQRARGLKGYVSWAYLQKI
ncbi:SH3 domain-containing protein [Ruegeria sp. A3M17]|uniref:SH3 domain-containing protein n=1 Tax=Ruegeria sp. A3M17 TaxID=2267229 RepID=UPI000DE9F734|nr:SH3 domain-containing protein [Ruegeria sp. A3M17]RBW53797.1 SH3 domain-containing protein [Ruegeria sp. A3M17]